MRPHLPKLNRKKKGPSTGALAAATLQENFEAVVALLDEAERKRLAVTVELDEMRATSRHFETDALAFRREAEAVLIAANKDSVL